MSSFRRRLMMQQGGGYEYVQDGLVFMLDCDSECSTERWTDKIGGVEFDGYNVSIVDGAPYFNGSAYYQRQHSLNYAYDTCTIEVVFKVPNIRSQYMFFIGVDKSIGASMQSTYYTMSCGRNAPVPKFGNTSVANTLTSVSAANTFLYENGVLKTNTSTDYWNIFSTQYDQVGCGGGRLPFIGSIYSIRIYNRKLTKAEVLANQAIDQSRWG